jgi:DNA-binding protein WhiA
MSFSSDVKSELCRVYSAGKHCCLAEIAAIANTCGALSGGFKFSEGEALEVPLPLKVQTENLAVAQKFFTLLKERLDLNPQASARCGMLQKRARLYSVRLSELPQASELSSAHQLALAGKRIEAISATSECCKKAYIRGAFIAGGSLSDPEKNYHLEFVTAGIDQGELLASLMGGFGLNAKVIERKGHYIVYLKEGENIVDLLNIMGAHQSLMSMENTRILREIRNNINRAVNCEAANMQKTVNASLKQIRDIKTIERFVGLEYLDIQLAEVARLRLKHRESSLKEIGGMLSPPVGKSGVSHRLRRISEIAEDLRGGLL